MQINLRLPGKKLVVNHNEEEDWCVSIRAVFDDIT